MTMVSRPRFSLPRLITFDAFGTIYSPKTSVAKQYVDFVKPFGLEVSEQHIHKSFGPAFKAVSAQYGNYGKNSSISLQDWWTRIIELAFHPHVLSPIISEGLYNHFNSSAAYSVYPDALDTVEFFRAKKVPLAILSNSDPRMRLVLKDLDIISLFDQVMLSYETGLEKPDSKAFDKAIVIMAQQISSLEDLKSSQCWHIGDEYFKDFEGAVAAGWNAILVDRTGEIIEEARAINSSITTYEDDDMLILRNSQIITRDLKLLEELFDEGKS